MQYRHLPFEQYFINTSEDVNNTGRATYEVKYTTVKYSHSKLEKKLHIEHEVDYEIHYEEDRDGIPTGHTGNLSQHIFFCICNNAIEFEDKLLQLRVHHGWGIMYKSIKREVRSKWLKLHEEHPDAETEVLGWSLGSGQAILCCQDLNFNYGVKPHLYTYGTVRPFKGTRADRERLKKYLDTVCTECWNFTDINDIVTYMPPFRGFVMINRKDVSEEVKRTFFKLLNPYQYHTTYDHAQLYIPYEEENKEE